MSSDRIRYFDGVVTALQGQLDRYQAADMRQANAAAAQIGTTLSEDAADQARQALADLFAERSS